VVREHYFLLPLSFGEKIAWVWSLLLEWVLICVKCWILEFGTRVIMAESFSRFWTCNRNSALRQVVTLVCTHCTGIIQNWWTELWRRCHFHTCHYWWSLSKWETIIAVHISRVIVNSNYFKFLLWILCIFPSLFFNHHLDFIFNLKGKFCLLAKVPLVVRVIRLLVFQGFNQVFHSAYLVLHLCRS
jgi:hypothetical protein